MKRNKTTDIHGASFVFPASAPVAIIDENLFIIYANSSFCSNFRLRGNNISELKSDPNLMVVIDSFAQSGYPNISLDFWLPRGDEGTNYNLKIERIIVEEQEMFLLLFHSFEEKIIIESKINNLHTAIESGSIPVLLANEDGEITFVSKSFEGIIGSSIDEIYKAELSLALKPLLVEEDLESLEASLKGYMPWSKIVSVNKDPESIYELKLKPVEKSGTALKNYILVANDITDYIYKNRLVQKSEKELKSIINNISDLLLIIKKSHSNYYFEGANDNFYRTFFINKDTSAKANITQVLDKDILKNLMRSFQRIESDSFRQDEFFLIRNMKNYSAKVTYFEDGYENALIYIISLRDITEQIRFQDQLRKAFERESHLNYLKTIFLENMSHEIRTPFNAIAGYSEIIKDAIESGSIDSLKEFTSSIKEVLSRILNLFTNIVEVSQIETGEISFERENIQCNSVLINVYNKKLEEAKNKQLNFILNLPEDEMHITADWIKFDKIITALVDNAIKYTNKGDIMLSLKENKEGEIEISVKDSGIGIFESEIPRLLEPFEQYEIGYTRTSQGAGLGLTIAYKLTRLMGGTFDIKSAKNAGTTITLNFKKAFMEQEENQYMQLNN